MALGRFARRQGRKWRRARRAEPVPAVIAREGEGEAEEVEDTLEEDLLALLQQQQLQEKLELDRQRREHDDKREF